LDERVTTLEETQAADDGFGFEDFIPWAKKNSVLSLFLRKENEGGEVDGLVWSHACHLEWQTSSLALRDPYLRSSFSWSSSLFNGFPLLTCFFCCRYCLVHLLSVLRILWK
jgi:hypothetical protein